MNKINIIVKLHTVKRSEIKKTYAKFGTNRENVTQKRM